MDTHWTASTCPCQRTNCEQAMAEWSECPLSTVHWPSLSSFLGALSLCLSKCKQVFSVYTTRLTDLDMRANGNTSLSSKAKLPFKCPPHCIQQSIISHPSDQVFCRSSVLTVTGQASDEVNKGHTSE